MKDLLEKPIKPEKMLPNYRKKGTRDIDLLHAVKNEF